MLHTISQHFRLDYFFECVAFEGCDHWRTKLCVVNKKLISWCQCHKFSFFPFLFFRISFDLVKIQPQQTWLVASPPTITNNSGIQSWYVNSIPSSVLKNVIEPQAVSLKNMPSCIPGFIKQNSTMSSERSGSKTKQLRAAQCPIHPPFSPLMTHRCSI